MRGRVDIEEALADPRVGDVLTLWSDVRRYPESLPAFSGGLLTSWPALAVDGLSVCRAEEFAIDDYLRFREEAERGSVAAPSR